MHGGTQLSFSSPLPSFLPCILLCPLLCSLGVEPRPSCTLVCALWLGHIPTRKLHFIAAEPADIWCQLLALGMPDLGRVSSKELTHLLVLPTPILVHSSWRKASCFWSCHYWSPKQSHWQREDSQVRVANERVLPRSSWRLACCFCSIGL